MFILSLAKNPFLLPQAGHLAEFTFYQMHTDPTPGLEPTAAHVNKCVDMFTFTLTVNVQGVFLFISLGYTLGQPELI